MYELALTTVGGLIAAGAGAMTTILTYRLSRSAERSALQRETLVGWVAAYEEWVSLYSDYSGLVLGKPSHPPDEWKNVFLRRLEQAAEAGRRLDVAKYRVLIVERRTWVRSEVGRLTQQSEVRSQTSSGDDKAQAQDFRLATDRLRADLEAFLRHLAAEG